MTTQLAIYPEGASYADRSFVWRVSTASVDAERSDFTLLPGVSRIIMVLEGKLRLIYNGSREVTLHRFGQNSFSGDWNTESIGRARDFNLMMKEGCTGSVEALELLPGTGTAISRLYTADGVVSGDSFTDIDKNFAAGNRSISEVYYALTGVRLSERGSVEVRLEPGDVYIRSCRDYEGSHSAGAEWGSDTPSLSAISGYSVIPEKLQAGRITDSPTVVIRTLIIHD